MPRGLGVKGGIAPSDNIYAPSVLISSTILTEGRQNMILTGEGNDFNPPPHPRKMVGTSIVINVPKFVHPGTQSETGPPL